MSQDTRVTQVAACRACGSARRRRFLTLPAMPLTDDFIPRERLGREFLHDIEVFVCEGCATVQTQHDVDVGDYYEDYQYAVGGSGTATRFMRLLAENVLRRFQPGRKGVKVLEVGSGDGAQLAAFQELGCDVLGFEPSSPLARLARDRGVPTVQGLFGRDSILSLPAAFRKVDLVVLSYTFDHLPQPREFLAAARSILDPDHGALVVEVHDLEKIIERGEFSLFEHEHSIYLTAAAAASMAAREGLAVIDFDPVPEGLRRANSLLFVATPEGSRLAAAFPPARPATPPAFGDPAFYDAQAARIQQAIKNVDAFVDRTVAAGKSIAGYGAGGRGVMTLAAMRSAGRLRYLVDKKPKRPGLVAPKSGLPLVGIPTLAESPVNEVLVFSFGYIEEIRADLAAFGYRPEQCRSLKDVLAGAAVP